MDKKMRDTVIREAKERMQMLGMNEEFVKAFLENRLIKIHVIHAEKKIMREELTKDEYEMIQRVEKELEIVVYYVIEDKGVWPDGEEFDRYTLAMVDTFVNDYDVIKEKCIRKYQTLPGYIINMEEPECSGQEEFQFRMIHGVMINVS